MTNPKIRFKKSDGSDYQDWQEKSLGSILKYEQPTKYIVKSDDYTGCTKYPVLTAGKSFILGYTDETEGIYNKGDVIIFDDFTCDSRYVDFQFKVKSSAMKMLTTINNTDSLKLIYELMNHIGFKPLGHQRHWISTMSEETITIPSDDKEQTKIANFLSEIDSLITSAEHEVESTKQLKKAMLQKMFPKNGEKVPEIRFSEFTDDWEQRKFGDLGSVAMCKRIFKEQTTATGEIPFYKIGTFGGEPDAFISRELFEEYKAKFSYPEVGDMLISASGTIGRTVEYTGKDEYFQDSNIVWFKHDDRIDNSFLRCLYSIVEWSGIEGSSIKRLYNDNFLKTEFMLPCVAEQRKVGSFFSHLDSLITLHQRKADTYKKFKKAMMQKMFV